MILEKEEEYFIIIMEIFIIENGKQENKMEKVFIFGMNVKEWKGDRYEGGWKDDKKEGDGVYYYTNNDKEMEDIQTVVQQELLQKLMLMEKLLQ